MQDTLLVSLVSAAMWAFAGAAGTLLVILFSHAHFLGRLFGRASDLAGEARQSRIKHVPQIARRARAIGDDARERFSSSPFGRPILLVALIGALLGAVLPNVSATYEAKIAKLIDRDAK